MRIIINTIFAAAIVTLLLVGCKDAQSPGVEYMPDMYRSPAIEVYVDYEFPDSSTVRHTPDNSIPRGYKPYPYSNDLAGFEMAGEQLKTPLKVTESTIKEGQKLYASFCAHCHGAKGKGKGSIQNAIYGAVPSYSDATPNRRGNRAMKELKEGHIYQAIMYGLNAMGPHSSLIREEDRWKIVAYVQTLQGNEQASTNGADSTDDASEETEDMENANDSNQ